MNRRSFLAFLPALGFLKAPKPPLWPRYNVPDSGTYLYKITYVTADGETVPGRSVTVSVNDSVTGRRIYRKSAGQRYYRLVSQINDNEHSLVSYD